MTNDKETIHTTEAVVALVQLAHKKGFIAGREATNDYISTYGPLVSRTPETIKRYFDVRELDSMEAFANRLKKAE